MHQLRLILYLRVTSLWLGLLWHLLHLELLRVVLIVVHLTLVHLLLTLVINHANELSLSLVLCSNLLSLHIAHELLGVSHLWLGIVLLWHRHHRVGLGCVHALFLLVSLVEVAHEVQQILLMGVLGQACLILKGLLIQLLSLLFDVCLLIVLLLLGELLRDHGV